MTAPAIDHRLSTIRRRLHQRRGEAISLAQTGQQLVADIRILEQIVDLNTRAAHSVGAIGGERQANAQKQIESLVSLGLATIFDDDLSFHLIPGVRAKTPVVDFVIRSRLADGTTVDTDVLTERGGGLAATVGFLLRLVILLLTRQRQDTILMLDETFAHVSAEYVPRLVDFLKDLVAQTGVQIIMVTHDEAFSEAADTVYRFELVNGVTKVKKQ